MHRRLAPALTLTLTLAVAALAACDGTGTSDRTAGAPRPRLADYNALSGPRGALGAVRRGPARPEVAGPLATRIDSRLGVPSFLWNRRTSRPAAAAPRGPIDDVGRARAHLKAHAGDYGLTAADVDGAAVLRVRGGRREPAIVRFQQRVRGVEVFRDQATVVLDRAGELVAIAGSLAPAADAPAGDPAALDARDAVAAALTDLTGTLHGATDLEAMPAAGGWARFDLAPAVAGALGERLVLPARARPTWFRMPGHLVPAVRLELAVARTGETETLAFGYVVSAIDGAVLYRRDLAQAAFQYRAFAEPTAPFSPFDGPQGFGVTPHPTGLPDGLQPPNVSRELVSLDYLPLPGLPAFADPWLAPGATETSGNNVDAYADFSGFDGFDGSDVRGVVTGPGVFDHSLDFGQAPGETSNRQAGIVQLFYTVNYLHDWLYEAGFDEAAGNAQVDNFGRGGFSGDPILAETQDWFGTDNARITTFADGQSPLLEMLLWSPSSAQYLDVTVPGGIPRAAAGVAPGFGPQSFTLSGDVVLADDGSAVAGRTLTDGCETPWANAAQVAGKIALVDRDANCTYPVKVKNAQLNGAIGVVIRGTLDSHLVGDMNGTDATITIPSLLVDKATGDAMGTVLAAPATLTVTMVRDAAPPARDGALDTTLVAHEWAHYMTNRLVGDAAGLDTVQSLGLAEGWSDFLALLLVVREGDDFGGTYALGPWVLGGVQPTGEGNDAFYFGGRRVPYSTSFASDPLTFRHFADGNALPGGVPVAFDADGSANSEIHNAGEVWATMLWECYAALLADTVGPTPRLTFAEAQLRMKRYLVTALELTPVSPTLLEARDALLAAAYANDPIDLARFWTAFARRGAGQGATGPDRWATDNKPVTESFVAPPDLRVTAAAFGAVTTPCDDADGLLDDDEAGTLTLTLENVGPAPLAALDGVTSWATVSSTFAGLTFPAGNRLAVGASGFHDLVPVAIPVRLAGAATRQAVPVTLTFPAGYLAVAGPVSTTVWVDFDELAAASAIDAFDATAFAWSPEADPLLSTEGAFSRVAATTGLELHAPNLGAPSDLRLVSPPMQVGAAGLVVQFKARHDFEADPVGTPGRLYYDGGVLEISTDGGATWTDATGAPATVTRLSGASWVAYPLAELSPDGFALNPLFGRTAFAARNPSWPANDTVRVALGNAFDGQTVRLRFRVGSDVMISAPGWWIDDVQVTGLLDTPFPAVVADRRACANGFPNADAGAPQQVDERDGGGNPITVALHAVPADGVGETYAWVQTGGPVVALAGATTTDPTFPTFEVLADTTLTFQLTLRYGTLVDVATTSVVVKNVNRPPLAEAGPNQAARRGDTVALDGGASSDGDADAVLTYAWTQTAGPAVVLSDPSAIAPTFGAGSLATGDVVTFQLEVTDDKGAKSTDTTSVTIVNSPPVPSAVAAPVVHRGDVVILDASASSDIDPATTLQYTWTRIAGTPDVTLEPAVTPGVVSFVAPVATGDVAYRFEVQVSDGDATRSATVGVLLQNRPPVADAGAPRTVRNLATLQLDGGTFTDPDPGTVFAFSWTQEGAPPAPSVPPAAGATATPSISPVGLVPGTVLTYRVTLQDDAGGSATDTVDVTVENTPPTAHAGDDATIRNDGAAVLLSALGSSDPDGGTAYTYAWTQTAGTPVLLVGADTAAPAFTAAGLTPGETLTFQLALQDGHGGTGTDSVSIGVLNTTPTASAGPDLFVRNGERATLDATGSFDPDAGTTWTYAWVQDAGAPVDLDDPAIAAPSFTPTGFAPTDTLAFTVTVDDGFGVTTSDTAVVTIVNTPPAVDAGATRYAKNDETFTLGVAVTDPDAGATFTYAWTQVAGPSVALSDAAAAAPTITPTGLALGTTLVYEVQVSDGQGGSQTAQPTVVIATSVPVADGSRSAPTTAHAGELVLLDGTASADADPGTELTFRWEQMSGPPVSLSNPFSSTATFRAPTVTGTQQLVFRLTVGDGVAFDSTDVVITVADRAPVVVVVATPSVYPGDPVELDASQSYDPDAGTLSFAWTQVSGPSVTLSGADTATASFTAPSVAAATDLVFEVTVDDGTTPVARQVTVTVRPVPSAPSEPDSGGCSCASGTIDPSIAALLPLGLLFRRRRRS
jgi:hypothetical protein